MRIHQLQPDNTNMHLRITHHDAHAVEQQIGIGYKLTGHIHRIAGGAERRDH
jgi:hypothetical protein